MAHRPFGAGGQEKQGGDAGKGKNAGTGHGGLRFLFGAM
jgi:hypothetical protein